MKKYENSFIRGASPSYTDDGTSENALSATLAIEADHLQASTDNFLDEKFNCVYDAMSSGPSKRGRNTFAFWTVVVVLLVLTVGNLILTLTIVGVLRLGKGIHGMELIPEEDVIKFYGTTDLDRVYTKQSGQIEGFTDVPVSITGEDGVYIRLHRNGQAHNRLTMDKSGIQFRAVNAFEVKDTTDGATIFTTHRPHYNMPSGADCLVAKTISASRIASPITQPLNLEADGRVYCKGSEGISLESANALLQAQSYDVAINSTEGVIVLEAGSGIFLDMDKVPIVSSEFGLRTGSIQYKICVCMPRGNLFRIAIPRIRNGPKVTCAHFSNKHDPCGLN